MGNTSSVTPISAGETSLVNRPTPAEFYAADPADAHAVRALLTRCGTFRYKWWRFSFNRAVTVFVRRIVDSRDYALLLPHLLKCGINHAFIPYYVPRAFSADTIPIWLLYNNINNGRRFNWALPAMDAAATEVLYNIIMTTISQAGTNLGGARQYITIPDAELQRRLAYCRGCRVYVNAVKETGECEICWRCDNVRRHTAGGVYTAVERDHASHDTRCGQCRRLDAAEKADAEAKAKRAAAFELTIKTLEASSSSRSATH